MKRTSLVVLTIALSCLSCFADRFVITDMNGRKSIQIGSRICHINSEFSSEEATQIRWNSSNVTLIEAQNIKTKTICYFIPNKKRDENQSTNVFQRFINWVTSGTKKLYSRENEEYRLEDVLTENIIYLADIIKIPINADKQALDVRKYYASFFRNGQKIILPLTIKDGYLIFNRSQFLYDGITFPYKYVLTIYYIVGDNYHEITNGMLLIIVD